MKEAPVCCISSTTVPVSSVRYRITWYVCQLGGWSGRRSFSRGVIHLLRLKKISYSHRYLIGVRLTFTVREFLRGADFSFNQAEKFGVVKRENKLGLFESWIGGWFVGWFVGRNEQNLLNVSLQNCPPRKHHIPFWCRSGNFVTHIVRVWVFQHLYQFLLE